MSPCPTPHKQRYWSRKEAKQTRTRLMANRAARELRAYLCECSFWHLGHIANLARQEGRAVAYRGEAPIVRFVPPRAEPVPLERLTNVLSAHEAFRTVLCPERGCPHVEPCPKHGERKAA